MKKGMKFFIICGVLWFLSACSHSNNKNEALHKQNTLNHGEMRPGRPGERITRAPAPVKSERQKKATLYREGTIPSFKEWAAIGDSDEELKNQDTITTENNPVDSSQKTNSANVGAIEDRALRKAVPKGSADQQTPKKVSQVNQGITSKSAKLTGTTQKIRIDDHGSVVHTITIPDKKLVGSSQFQPKIVRLKVGEFIEWINEDTRTHFINKKREGYKAFSSYNNDNDYEDEEREDPSKELNSKVIKPKQKWKFQFTKTMTLTYYCFIHPREMTGTIIVE